MASCLFNKPLLTKSLIDLFIKHDLNLNFTASFTVSKTQTYNIFPKKFRGEFDFSTTTLFIAAAISAPEIVKMLLLNGASPEITLKSGAHEWLNYQVHAWLKNFIAKDIKDLTMADIVGIFNPSEKIEDPRIIKITIPEENVFLTKENNECYAWLKAHHYFLLAQEEYLNCWPDESKLSPEATNCLLTAFRYSYTAVFEFLHNEISNINGDLTQPQFFMWAVKVLFKNIERLRETSKDPSKVTETIAVIFSLLFTKENLLPSDSHKKLAYIKEIIFKELPDLWNTINYFNNNNIQANNNNSTTNNNNNSSESKGELIVDTKNLSMQLEGKVNSFAMEIPKLDMPSATTVLRQLGTFATRAISPDATSSHIRQKDIPEETTEESHKKLQQ